MRDNGHDEKILKYLTNQEKTLVEINEHFDFILTNSLKSMLKRFVRDGLAEKIFDETQKTGNGLFLVRYRALDVPKKKTPVKPSLYSLPWGCLPSAHSMGLSV